MRRPAPSRDLLREHVPRALVVVFAVALSAGTTFALTAGPPAIGTAGDADREAFAPGDSPGMSSAPTPGARRPDSATLEPAHAGIAPEQRMRGVRWATRPGSSWAHSSLLDPPEVVRFRPRAGWTGVSQGVNLSVRFTSAMDRDATAAAFTASIDGDSVTGRTWWAEGDTVLVLDPAAPLPRGAVVVLEVAAGARSVFGIGLADPARIAFTVARGPATVPNAPRVAGGRWAWPLAGPITQRFGESLTAYGRHQGIDIDGETGDPVRAARAGRVTVAGTYDACGGLEVHIDHGSGVGSWYRHLSRIDVDEADEVAAGTVIGAVGSTGCSLGSHLHFAIRRGSMFVDPLLYLPRR